MKVKTGNRVLALLMSVMMVFCFMPSITFAADGDSTADAAAVNAAIASAENGQVIKLENDITGAVLVPEGKNVVIDLNGKTVTAESGKVAVTNNGTLTIRGEGTVIASGNYAVSNHGTMTIDSGTFQKTDPSATQSLIANGYYNAADNTDSHYCRMTINGGSFDGGAYTAVKNDSFGKMEINGGTITSTQGQAGVQEAGSEFVVKGGTFDAIVWVQGYSSVDGETKEAVFSGGTFNKAVNLKPDNKEGVKAKEVKVSIGSDAVFNSNLAIQNTYSPAGTNQFVIEQFDVKSIGGTLSFSGADSSVKMPAISLDGLTVGGLTLSYVHPSTISNTIVNGKSGIKAGVVTLKNVTAKAYASNAIDGKVTVGSGTTIDNITLNYNKGNTIIVDGGTVENISSTGKNKMGGYDSIIINSGSVGTIETSKGAIIVNGGSVDTITILDKYVTTNDVSVTVKDGTAVRVIDNQREGDAAATAETIITLPDGYELIGDLVVDSAEREQYTAAFTADNYNLKGKTVRIPVTVTRKDSAALDAAERKGWSLVEDTGIVEQKEEFTLNASGKAFPYVKRVDMTSLDSGSVKVKLVRHGIVYAEATVNYSPVASITTDKPDKMITDGAEEVTKLTINSTEVNLADYTITSKDEEIAVAETAGGKTIITPKKAGKCTFTVAEKDDPAKMVEASITFVEPTAKIGENYYNNLNKAFNAAKSGDTIELCKDTTESVFFSGTMPRSSDFEITVDLTGHTWTGASDEHYALRVDYGAVTVKDSVGGGGVAYGKDYAFIVSHLAGNYPSKLILESGTFTGKTSVVQAGYPGGSGANYKYYGGDLVVNGGHFVTVADTDEKYDANGNFKYTLNMLDMDESKYAGGIFSPSTITVKGGTFEKFDPMNNEAEGAKTDFTAEGYISVNKGDGNYDVVATCKVTFVFGNSMDDEVVTLPVNTKAEKPADPERNGYTFGGWFNGEEPFDFDSPVKNDITLKAKWTKAELTMPESIKGVAGNTVSALSVKIDGKTATTEQKENIKWRSDDESVVKIGEDGKLTFLKEGTATITAKYFDSEAFCEVTVNEATVEYTASNGKVTYYDSIPSAFSPGTYKLLADVTKNTRMTPGILASDVTIDLNGHTLTSSATDCAILLSRTGSASAPKKFAIVDTSDAKDGKLVVNEGANAAVQVQGKYNEVTIGKGVTVDGGCVALLAENQILTVNGTINGGKDFAIATNGSKTKNATIDINDGAVLTSDVTAIYLPGTGTTTISGGSITGATAVYQKSGTLNITGGEFNATGEKKEFSHNGNGANATGDAIVVESSDYPGGLPKVSITGGIFTSENAEPVASYSQDEEKYEPVKNFVKPAEGSSIISNKEIAEEELAEGYISIEIKKGENKGKFEVRKGAEITVEDIAALTFTGFEQDPELTVKSGDDVLTADDYTVEYKAKEGDKNAKLGENNKPLNAGTYVLTVKGTGDYKTAANGTVTKEVVVDQADLSKATVSVKPSSYLFENGGPFEPEVTAYIGKDTTKYDLTEGTDFTVSYANNTVVGTAKATITAKDGGNFKGTKEKTYKINAAAAKVDDTYYATLAAAINGAKGNSNGKTVEVLTELNISGLSGRFSIGENDNITIDLGGHTLNTNGGYIIMNGGKMAIKNGTINTKGNMSQFITANAGEVTVEDSAIINGQGKVSPIAVFGPVTINTAGKLTAENSFAIAGNGSAGKGGYTINITGGEVISTGASAVYHPNEGTVNISGGTITGTTAVYQKSGTLNITGGELNATGEKKEFTHNGNGAGATGDAIVIENCGYQGGSPVTNISGGTVISKNAEPVASYAYGDSNNAEEDFVTGGVFNKEIADEVIAPGYGIKARDDGMFEIHKHEVKKTEAIAPTCLEDGNIEYYTCEICGKFFEDEQATKQLEEKELTVLSTGKEHDWNEWTIVMPATCTEPGLQIHDCKNDPTHKDYEVIKPTGHKITKVDAVAATCEEDGNIEYYTCENCGKFFSDADGKTEITEADTIITAKGHNWDAGEVITEATCETDGVKTLTCKNDKSHTKTEVIPAIGHKWSKWKTTKEATCSEKGTEERICENDAEHKETREISVDPKAHKWGEWKVDKEATCTEAGSKYRVCEHDADHRQVESIPATGHNLKKVDAVAATCEEDGNIEYYTCENCGKFFSDVDGKIEITKAETVAVAKGHDWDEGTVTKEPTTEEEGVKTFTCKNDPAHTKTEPIPKLETEKKPEPDNTADQDKKPETQNQDPGNTTDQGNQSGQQNEDLEQMSSDVTAVGPGVSASIAEKAITSMKNDNDPAGSSFSKLRLRSPRQAKKAVKLSWSKVPGAAKYVLYGNQCGSKNKMKKIATLKKNSLNVKKAVKKLKKGTYYKFLIVAIDNNDNVVSTSKVIHVATKGSRKAANPKKVIVKAKVNKKGKKLKKYKATGAIALRAGKTTQLKANITKPKKSKVRKHVNPRYESANTKIATVTSKGKVRGVKKGKTTIYVYAQNGIFKAVKVRVK